jgi:VWFA-related protein
MLPPMKIVPTLIVLSSLALAQETASTTAPATPTSTAAAPPAASAEQPKPAVRPMTVLVSLTDSGGNPVSGVGKENVHVLDTGHNASVLNFANAEPLPIQLVLILYSSRSTFKQQQKAAADLAQQVLRPGKDEALVMVAGSEKMMEGQLNWEADPVKVVEKIKALDYKVGLPDAFSYSIQIDKAGMNRNGLEIQGGSNNSVFEIAYQLMVQDKRPMRRVIVTFRNPMNHAPGFNQRFADYVAGHHDQIIGTAQALRAMIFTIITDEPSKNSSGTVDIGQGYVPMTSGEASQDQLRHADESVNRQISQAVSSGRQNVERLALETGGKAFMAPKKNYEDAVAGITNAIKAQYALTFQQAEVTGPRAITVTAAGATVNAPKSYPHAN